MNITGDVWPLMQTTSTLNLTTTAYHFDFTSDKSIDGTGDNFRFLDDLLSTPDNIYQGHQTSTLWHDLAKTKSSVFNSSRASRNSSAYHKRVKVTQEHTHTCSLFRRVFNTYVVGLMCLLGIIGNIVSILVLQKDKNNKVAIFLLQSLAAADVILLIMSFLILSVYHGFMVDYAALRIYHRSLMPYIIAHVNPIAVVAQAMVIWCTVLLAINRYIAICKPFAARKWLTMNWARAQVLTVFITSILLNLPRHFEYKLPRKTFTDPETNTIQYFIHLQRTVLGNSWHLKVFYFHSFYNAFVHVLPLLLLVCINIPIIRSLQRSKRIMQRNSLVYSGRRENNITVVMIIIIVQLLVCHTPDKIACIYRDIIPQAKTGCPHPLYFTLTIGNIFVIINSSTDFIVYYLFRKRFRYYLKSRLCCIKNFYSGVSRISHTEGDYDMEEISFMRMNSNNVQVIPHPPLTKRSTT